MTPINIKFDCLKVSKFAGVFNADGASAQMYNITDSLYYSLHVVIHYTVVG